MNAATDEAFEMTHTRHCLAVVKPKQNQMIPARMIPGVEMITKGGTYSL